jgi:hypothetical protein
MVSTSVFETVYIGSTPVKCSYIKSCIWYVKVKEVSYNGYYRRLPNDLFQFDSGYFQLKKINKSNTWTIFQIVTESIG